VDRPVAHRPCFDRPGPPHARPNATSRGALPNLIVIGFGRCGTTSLHHQLSDHPDVAMSRVKELRFFADAPDEEVLSSLEGVDRRLANARRGAWTRGLDWYRAQFDPTAPVRGESSPVYTAPAFTSCAARIAKVVPDARLVLCVRDPVDRAISNYRHARALGREPRPPEVALRPDGFYAMGSRYTDRIAPFLEHFPWERIHILDRSDPGIDGATALRGVFRFLGVDDGVGLGGVERRWNASSQQQGGRWRLIVRLRDLPGWSRVAALPPRRTLWALERITGAGRDAAPNLPVPGEIRARLADALREDAARFRSLTGRPFPGWSV
jgi:hypothetical protein